MALPEVVMTLRRISRSMPAMPIALSSPPMVVGARQTKRATSTVIVTGTPAPACLHAVERERPERGTDHDEDRSQPDKENVEGDLVWGLLPFCTFDEADHVVEETFAGIGARPDDEPVREDDRAAGDSAPVTTGLPDHRCTLTGDRTLVHRGDPFDDLPVDRDGIPGLDIEEVRPVQR